MGLFGCVLSVALFAFLVAGDDFPDPLINSSSHVCAKDKSITVCRFNLTTRGQHKKAIGGALTLEGTGQLVKGQNHFHESGDIQSSCLSFLHGDSQDLEKDLSSIRVQGSKIDLAWFFRDKHDENAKDQLVLQLAYQGPGPLTGDLYAYSTSQLHFTSKVVCKSLAEFTVPPRLAKERAFRAQELAKELNLKAPLPTRPAMLPPDQPMFPRPPQETVSARNVIRDANRAKLEGLKQARFERQEKERLEKERLAAADLVKNVGEIKGKKEIEATKKSSKKRSSIDDDEDADVLSNLPPSSSSVWGLNLFTAFGVFVCLVVLLLFYFAFVVKRQPDYKKRY